jgi:hypothetical protein
MKGIPSAEVISRSRAATCEGWRGLSITHGPAIRKNGPDRRESVFQRRSPVGTAVWLKTPP